MLAGAAASTPLAIKIAGVNLIGINARTGYKFGLTIGLVAVVLALRYLTAHVLRRLLRNPGPTGRFWLRQGVQLVAAVVMLLGVVSIWFDTSKNFTTAAGLVTAGLAFALQQVVLSVAGYFVILKGDVFSVGDRITIGPVRGDVIRLGFVRTKVLEMGEPPPVQGAEPAVWVQSRQHTGRIVTISNGQIFTDPVYNYTRDFPYLWEEMMLPITYDSDRGQAEKILLEAARGHALRQDQLDPRALHTMRWRYGVHIADCEPRVYWRITDNWLELTVRFLTYAEGIRQVKDAMSRDILAGLDRAGIGVASATYDIVGMPPLRISHEGLRGT